jgi:hypothetical protein
MIQRQAITGVRQKACTAHSSITTTLMDYQATKLGGPPRPPRGDTNAPYEKVLTPLDILTFYIRDRFFTENFADFTIFIFIFNLITCIRTTSRSTDCGRFILSVEAFQFG